MVRGFNRRELFRGVSAISVLSAVGGLESCTSGPKYLNVIIHGLSALIVQPPSTKPEEGITLFCPEIIDSTDDSLSHSYLCGTLSSVSGQETKGLISMTREYDYKLVGVKAGARPSKESFGALTNLSFTAASITANGTGKRKFTLPWPSSIASVAVMERSDGKPLVTDISSGSPNANLYWASTITVLVYEIDGSPRILWGSTDIGWRATAAGNPHFSNLHIFAEPKGQPDTTHAINAFKVLMGSLVIPQGSLSGLVSFNTYPGVRQLPDAVVPPGLSRDPDLQHLHHFFPRLTGHGGELANCVRSLVIVG
jgi:hypothetical protein